jgi:hypothetical protein
MPQDDKLAAYCSHSWRPRDVNLNLHVWEELASDCELLVGVPDEPGANPPYYINRIEELLRRWDLFLGQLVEREPRCGAHPMRCSRFVLPNGQTSHGSSFTNAVRAFARPAISGPGKCTSRSIV